MDDLLNEMTKPSTWIPLLCSALFVIGGLIIEYRTGLFSQRKKKELSYEIVSTTELVNKSDPSIDEKLTLYYDGSEIISAKSIVIRIANTGNIPITTSDFEGSDIVIHFNGNLVWVSSIVHKFPEDLNLKLTISPKDAFYISIAPLLLNPGDEFTFSALVEGVKTEAPRVKVRIIGVEEIKSIKESFKVFSFLSPKNFFPLLAFYFLLLLISVAFLNSSAIYFLLILGITILSFSTSYLIGKYS